MRSGRGRNAFSNPPVTPGANAGYNADQAHRDVRFGRASSGLTSTWALLLRDVASRTYGVAVVSG
jgi:hypothetical protein